jgi:hypothetical protein
MIDGVEWVDEPAATAMHFQRRSDSAARRGESQDAALFAIAAAFSRRPIGWTRSTRG